MHRQVSTKAQETVRDNEFGFGAQVRPRSDSSSQLRLRGDPGLGGFSTARICQRTPSVPGVCRILWSRRYLHKVLLHVTWTVQYYCGTQQVESTIRRRRGWRSHRRTRLEEGSQGPWLSAEARPARMHGNPKSRRRAGYHPAPWLFLEGKAREQPCGSTPVTSRFACWGRLMHIVQFSMEFSQLPNQLTCTNSTSRPSIA